MNFKPAESQDIIGKLRWMENKGNKRTDLLNSSSPCSQLVSDDDQPPTFNGGRQLLLHPDGGLCLRQQVFPSREHVFLQREELPAQLPR
ncbi:hypothetical protein AV530_008876 [Patagioenas fasciata monilis]|uniref:Uncharacterized protein n=1 Tax=Patagioenas fasciata monilis TaxID=372326 RepID=A0A1V4KSM4_PATFA|nr:hypothetical protein AV530_008876 [Patagioenas fasciata monilis]